MCKETAWMLSGIAALVLSGCETHIHNDGPPARVEVEPRRGPAKVDVEVKPRTAERPGAKVDVNIERR